MVRGVCVDGYGYRQRVHHHRSEILSMKKEKRNDTVGQFRQWIIMERERLECKLQRLKNELSLAKVELKRAMMTDSMTAEYISATDDDE